MILTLSSVQNPSEQMRGPVGRARKQQKKTLRSLRKMQRVTNSQYRKNTRTERGLDFASQNNAKFGDMIGGIVDRAGAAFSAWATGGTSVVAEAMNGTVDEPAPIPPWVAPAALLGAVAALGYMLK